MKEFKTYHPIVNFIYFIFVIGFSVAFMHPIFLSISLVSGFLYLAMLKGKKMVKSNLIYIISVVVAMTLINPVISHQGITILMYLPSGNPLTFESIVYGFCAALMIVSVIYHFSCYNEIMTSDKFIYLFGKIIPHLSLIISMTLRFVPKFAAQIKVVANAQRCLGRDASSGNIIKRAKNGLNILSIMTTWSLENAIETADSMKSRGFGQTKRTAFSIYTFDKRDKKALIWIVFLAIYIIAGKMCGGMYFRYYPSIVMARISVFEISLILSYLLLFLTPIIIELWEVRKWKLLRSKI